MIINLITLENYTGCLTKIAKVSFLLKIVIVTEQIGSDVQKYTGWHLTGFNGFVGQIYTLASTRLDRKVYFRIPLSSRLLLYKLRCDYSKFTTNTNLMDQEICILLAWSFNSYFCAFSRSVKCYFSHWNLKKFTQKTLNDSNQAISLLNSEVSIMSKAVLQNCIALDILTASQGYAYAIIQTGCCIYIPDESSNVWCFRKMV